MDSVDKRDAGAVLVRTLASTPQKRISETHRFLLLAIGAFSSICCSFGYAFNLISVPMQVQYDFSQRDMSTIITVSLAIQYFSLPYAFLYDFLGPIPISILALLYCTSGTVLLAQAFAGNIEASVVRLTVFNTFLNCGCSMFDCLACVTVLSHFPTANGAVIALLKTFTGLGSAIVGAVFLAFFTSSVEQYFYFLMSIVIVVAVMNIIFMRLPTYHLTIFERRCRLTPEEIEEREASKAQYLRQDPPVYRFMYGFVILVFLITFLPAQGALVAYLKLGQSYKTAFAIIVIVFTLAFAFIPIPLSRFLPDWFREGSRAEELPSPLSDFPSQSGHEPMVNGEEKPTAVAGRAVVNVETEVDYLAPQYQKPFLSNLLSVELWCLWWTFFTIVGAEFVVIFNATFLLAALDGKLPDDSLRTLLTVLNGAGSAVGRLVMSYLEYWTQKRRAEDRIPITIALFLPTTSIIITIILFLTLPGAALPLPYVVAALGNGFLAAAIVLTARTLFAQDPAKHYSFCFTSTSLSVVVLNKLLYGEWYTIQAEKQGSKVCYGKNCVLMPLLVLLGLACTAFISDVVLHLRYRAYCQRVLAERARQREEVLRLERADGLSEALS